MGGSNIHTYSSLDEGATYAAATAAAEFANDVAASAVAPPVAEYGSLLRPSNSYSPSSATAGRISLDHRDLDDDFCCSFSSLANAEESSKNESSALTCRREEVVVVAVLIIRVHDDPAAVMSLARGDNVVDEQ